MKRPLTVELAGYLTAAVGVGEAARLYLQALTAVGARVLPRDVPLPGRDSAGSALLGASGDLAPAEIGFNLFCLNPEQLVSYLESEDCPKREGRVSIGIWSWEVDVLPPGWREAASGLSEVWTYSRFSAARIGAAIGKPVHAVPPPVGSHTSAEPRCALPDGFRVLVMFDFLSTMQRKNPLGAIAAYRAAFRPEDGAALVLKSINGRHRPDLRDEVLAAIDGRPDVVLVDQTMSSAERYGLIDACDCVLSLHRSEGHGLILAEGMAAGKPVVATDYGGNAEFMSVANSYPVPWRPTLVGPAVEHYPAGASWAEPDVAAAARLLREVHDRPVEVARRVRCARRTIDQNLAPHVIGSHIQDRLQNLDREGTRMGRLLVRLRDNVRGQPAHKVG